jgi:hypothetical protein
VADLGKVAEATARLIDVLEKSIADDDEIGEILLIAEVTRPATEDTAEASYMQWHCSSGRFLIQKGLVSWAYAAMQADAMREVDGSDDDAED